MDKRFVMGDGSYVQGNIVALNEHASVLHYTRLDHQAPSEIRSFLLDAKQQMRRQPQEVITAREISLNPTQLDLKRRINALDQERTTLLRTYLPDAPPVREAEENLRLMRELGAEPTTPAETRRILSLSGGGLK